MFFYVPHDMITQAHRGLQPRVCGCLCASVRAQNKHMSCLSVYCACFIVLIKLLFPYEASGGLIAMGREGL